MSEEKAELIRKLDEKIAKYQALKSELLPKEETPMVEPYIELEKRVHLKPNEPKYGTGIQWLDDRMNGGFTRGSYINLAGVSFSGKSTLALKILTNIASYNKAVFFSLEMYENILVNELRGLTETQKINLQIVQKGYAIEDIEKIIREQAKEGVVFFAIDSKMKIKTSFDGKEYQQISKLSNMLARLTQELGIILLLINQINEEDRKNGKFGLKGSGDQVYDSDVVLYIDVVKKENQERRLCYCTKDRYNKRKWVEDITENNVEVIIYKEDKQINMVKL